MYTDDICAVITPFLIKMSSVGQTPNYAKEISLMKSLFGDIVTEDVIATVIESCEGDVNHAADVIMNLDQPVETTKEIENINNEPVPLPEATTTIEPDILLPHSENVVTNNDVSTELPTSFSEPFVNTGAIPRRNFRNITQEPKKKIGWSDEIPHIITCHNEGTRILILMRGVSGSGKSFKARQIVEYTVGPSADNYDRHIFSADNFFIRRGVYQFNQYRLPEAHIITQKQVCDATNKGISPIIVDNTNTEIWEMEPYVRDGVRNGYVIVLSEPDTNWARNANQLTKKNIHGVPRESIIRMLDRYENITAKRLLKILKLEYPTNKTPPVLRNYPPFIPPESPQKSARDTHLKVINSYDKNQVNLGESNSQDNVTNFTTPDSPVDKNIAKNITEPEKSEVLLTAEDELKLQRIIEAQKQIECFEKAEKEWEDGESWDATVRNANEVIVYQDQAMALDPKPPRGAQKPEKLLESCISNDWTKISMFMSPWQDDKVSTVPLIYDTQKVVETKEESTSIDLGDLNNSTFKILYAQPRVISVDIPEINTPNKRLKIMLEKSTSTHDNDTLLQTPECEHKELHFKAFSRLLKSAPTNELREIFDYCNSDVNWALNLILDSYPEWIKNTDKNDDGSDLDEDPIEQCQCLAAYNIIPDVAPRAIVSPVSENKSQSLLLSQKKPKREMKISESLLNLKRQIENNVTIPDNHYSDHYLNLRRRRENNTNVLYKPTSTVDDANPAQVIIESDNAIALPESSQHDHSCDILDIVKPNQSNYNSELIDPNDSDTESDSDKSDSFEPLVPVNLGTEFLSKLDEVFGRKGFQYPENIKTTVDLPMSILRQINAYWAMSVASQLDDESKLFERMIKQDEDFARNLAAQEENLSREGKEPDVPSLKEIMDMELAYSIYERNVAEWRNNEPQDLAAKLSRDKLYNLFPDLRKDVLSEILMAHDYQFKETIESLLVSTGQASWLEAKQGVEKFVMEKELKRKAEFIEQENKVLTDSEWPSLSEPEKPINLDTVNFYRAEAQKYLQFRNTNYEKARLYFANNSPHAASFYSDIAALHTKKYEHSSCLAATYLMKYHLKNNPDKDVLDLHFLRVAEAMVNLDIFLDGVIQRLRQSTHDRFKDVFIITGKGTHSLGGPRIKPATKRRLKARDIPNKLLNGGLLMAQIFPTNKLTNELAESENS